MGYLICILISMLIISVYMLMYVLSVGQLPTSISDTHYEAKLPWMFPGTIILAVGLVTPALFELTPEMWRFLAFLIIGGLLFVAATPAFREEFQGKVHMVGALIAGAACIAYLIIMAGVPWIALGVMIFVLADLEKWCFFIELGLLANLYTVLIERSIEFSLFGIL